MRSDTSKSKRETDAQKLRDYLESLPMGRFLPILDWYAKMDELGLSQSARQRLSDLRDQGLWMDFDRTKKGFMYNGFQADKQLPLLRIA